jgi:hypothetical protein
MPRALRYLFATILAMSGPSDPAKLWWEHRAALTEDYTRRMAIIVRTDTQDVTAYITAAAEYKALVDIDGLLRQANAPTTLQKLGMDLPAPPVPPAGVTLPHDLCPVAAQRVSLLYEREVGYYRGHAVQCELRNALDSNITAMNEEQRAAFNAVSEAVQAHANEHTPCPAPFFIHSVGGCGKTFLEDTLLGTTRLMGRAAIATASTGVAAQLLQGGITTHSAFHLALKFTGSEESALGKLSDMACLLKEHCSLVVIDEATMLHRGGVDQVDKTLRDVCQTLDVPFGGVPVVFAGDFGQTLPIVKHGGPQQQVAASLCSAASPVWGCLRHMQLTRNVRVQRLLAIDNSNAQRLQAWEELLLNVRCGEGTQPFVVPPDMRVHDRSLDSLLAYLFGDVAADGLAEDAVLQRAVLTPLRASVDRVNATMFERMQVPPDHQRTYIAADELADDGDSALHGPDVLATLQPDGLPAHALHLKVGMPVMIMRNISGVMGLVNGARLRASALHSHCVQGRVLTGRRRGETVLIPRILLTSDDDKLPFQIRRLQLPLHPCFAMTINKAQGQTLQRVGLWLPTPCFAHGQLYVALSRCGDPANVRVLLEHARVPGAPHGDEGDWTTTNVVCQEVLHSVQQALAGNAPVLRDGYNDHCHPNLSDL